MTEEIKYYTGNCITDLHTDTSISCNEEKCKQYTKSDGLKFCMSSVCPEKDCIYALVNKLHQTIDRLEQEIKTIREHCKQVDETNKILYKEKCDLIQENEKLKECYDGAKILNDAYIELTGKYKQALEEIKKYIVDELCGYYHSKKDDYDEILENIENKIDEVLNESN